MQENDHRSMPDNRARMAYNPPSADLVAVGGPLNVGDDGSTWRAANGKRALERATINSACPHDHEEARYKRWVARYEANPGVTRAAND